VAGRELAFQPAATTCEAHKNWHHGQRNCGHPAGQPDCLDRRHARRKVDVNMAILEPRELEFQSDRADGGPPVCPAPCVAPLAVWLSEDVPEKVAGKPGIGEGQGTAGNIATV
jgi:hypothetical protein